MQGTAQITPTTPGDAPADDRHLVRDRSGIRALLQALAQQRAILSAHVDGRGEPVPSVVLGIDEDGLLLDGSPTPSINARTAGARFLLCFARLGGVTLRFRVDSPRQVEEDGYVAFRVPPPTEIHHPQRRDLYRLETSPGDSPWCRFPATGDGEALRLRVVDISAGGLAVMPAEGQGGFEPGTRHAGAVLELPEGVELVVTLVACSLSMRKGADGQSHPRVGMRFEDLPRGADGAIQRHIFRIARERRARQGNPD